MKFEKQLCLKSKKEGVYPKSGTKYWSVRLADIVEFESMEITLADDTDGEALTPGEMYTAVIEVEKDGYRQSARNVNLFPIEPPAASKKS